LAYQRRIELKLILIDYPLARRRNDPDVEAVSQLNYLTGLQVPVAVGPSRPFAKLANQWPELPPWERTAAEAVLRLLDESDRPVVINITGSCRAIAAAGSRAPDLFADKCAGIYLNAGTGSPDPRKAAHKEYNVTLDVKAYTQISKLPCPVYWMPCFEEFGGRLPDGGWPVRDYGTYFRFQHKELLPHLSDRLVNFFTFMYRSGRRRAEGPPAGWLRHLLGPRDKEFETRLMPAFRNMWCTGGFLHSAGLGVTRAGRIVPLQSAGDEAAFKFEPIELNCDESGLTRWRPAPGRSNRFIFHVLDRHAYRDAMSAALRELLASLP